MPDRRPAIRPLGFTLIEIAIVLIIISLLLGGVLKGQELINNAKTKSLISDFQSIPLLIYAYQEKYHAMPGDDAMASQHLGARATLTPSAATLGNGLIDGAFNSIVATDESVAFWQQVRLANLTTGSTDFSLDNAIAAAVPRNVEGGRIGIQSVVPISRMTGSLFICADAISGKSARQIDTALDDGLTDTGLLRVMATGYNGNTPSGTALGLSAIDSETRYIVCASL